MILAVDPGGTTGVSWWIPTEDAEHDPTFAEIPDGDLGFARWFNKSIIVPSLRMIVCESFIPRPGARSMQMDALYIIGALRYYVETHSYVEFKLQSPAQAKSFATNDKLKAAGWYPKGLGHAQDSARHLLTYVVTSDPQGAVAQRVAKGVLS